MLFRSPLLLLLPLPFLSALLEEAVAGLLTAAGSTGGSVDIDLTDPLLPRLSTGAGVTSASEAPACLSSSDIADAGRFFGILGRLDAEG